MDLADCLRWVFDLDGTLTIAVHDFDAIRAELGLAAGRPILEELEGMDALESAPRRARLEAIERDLARAARPALGAAGLLSALRTRGARLGILTRNSRENALLTLEAAGLGAHFLPEDVIGRGQAPPKPDPAGLRALLARWAAPPERAVMVGDYRFDLEAGRAAGVPTVHVDPRGRFAWPELADVTARRLDELLPGLELEA